MVQGQEAADLTIGKLASAVGVGVETVRFYQRQGLLRTPAKSGGYRYYTADDLRRLKFIRQAKTAGFTLAEIGELLQLDAIDDRSRANALAMARIDALDARIAELQSARAALQGLAADCSSGAKGRCPILTAFDG